MYTAFILFYLAWPESDEVIIFVAGATGKLIAYSLPVEII
jgi:hypothetical protein